MERCSKRTIRDPDRFDPAQHAATTAVGVDRQSLRRMLQTSEGITANLFHIVNSLAVEAIESGQERITDAAVERWEPEFDAEAAFA